MPEGEPQNLDIPQPLYSDAMVDVIQTKESTTEFTGTGKLAFTVWIKQQVRLLIPSAMPVTLTLNVSHWKIDSFEVNNITLVPSFLPKAVAKFFRGVLREQKEAATVLRREIRKPTRTAAKTCLVG